MRLQSAIVQRIIALKAEVEGVAGDSLQIFNLESKAKLKSVQFPQSVVFWKWITPSKLGLVTATAAYHWDMEVSAEHGTAAKGLILQLY